MELTNDQWERIKDMIPAAVKRSDGRGKPLRDNREVMEAILWILRTGAPWKDLPSRYPPYQTCHRRFQKWQESGVIRKGVLAP